MPDEDTPRCTAKTSRGTPCKRSPINGGTVCATHGGRAPQVKAAAERRLQEAAAREAAERVGVLVVVSPQQALLDEVHRAAGMVAFYGARVAEAAERGHKGLVYGETKREAGVDKNAETDLVTLEARPSIWLVLWGEERDRLARVSAVAIKAGIEERRVQLAEQQGQVLASVIRGVLDAMLAVVLDVLGEAAVRSLVEAAWREQVPVVVPAQLRQLGGE